MWHIAWSSPFGKFRKILLVDSAHYNCASRRNTGGIRSIQFREADCFCKRLPILTLREKNWKAPVLRPRHPAPFEKNCSSCLKTTTPGLFGILEPNKKTGNPQGTNSLQSVWVELASKQKMEFPNEGNYLKLLLLTSCAHLMLIFWTSGDLAPLYWYLLTSLVSNYRQ